MGETVYGGRAWRVSEIRGQIDLRATQTFTGYRKERQGETCRKKCKDGVYGKELLVLIDGLS